MTTDPLDQLWHSPANQPPLDAGPRLASEFVTRLRRRRTFQAWWLAWVFLALTAATTLGVIQIVRSVPGDFSRQWTLAPLIVAPWFAALHLLRDFCRQPSLPVGVALSVSETLRLVEAANRSEVRRLTVVRGLIGCAIPLSGFAIWQLREIGKLPGQQMESMAVVFALALVGGFTAVTVRRLRLLAEREVIEARLNELKTSVDS